MNIFKSRRIELDLSIADVVSEINYPISIIEAIERDDVNFLPKPYLYYCVKCYGKYLKISNLSEVIKIYE